MYATLNTEQLNALSTLVCYSHDAQQAIEARYHDKPALAHELCTMVKEDAAILRAVLVKSGAWTPRTK